MILEAERRFGSDSALIGRLEQLEEKFPGKLTLLPEGMAVFGPGPFTVQETRLGEGIMPALFANPDSRVRGILTKPLVVYTVMDDSEVDPNGKTLEFALSHGFDGVMSIPTHRRGERPYELLLPSHQRELFSIQEYVSLPVSQGEEKLISEVAQNLRDSWSDAMPLGDIHFGEIKVRRNWWAGVIAALDNMREGLYTGELSESLKTEINQFINDYRRPGLSKIMTGHRDIERANDLLTKILREASL